MSKKFLCILTVILCLSLLVFTACANASDRAAGKDFGDFSSDTDFDYDHGSSSDSGDISDYGGSIGGGGFYPIIIGGGSGYDDGYGGQMSCSAGDMMIVLVILVIILVVLWLIMRNRQTPVTTTVLRTDDAALTPMETYIAQHDPNFSVVDMQKKLANLYVQLQDGWSAKDITSLRPYLTDELYEQSDRQLDAIRKSEQTPHIDNIAVLGTEIRGFFQRDNMDHIIVEMSTRINTYSTDDNTGEVVRGDKNAEKFMTYEWDLIRPTGVKTEEADAMQSVNCPNCGAPVSINKTAKCPYCDTVITINAKDWVLASIKGLSQRTN